MQAGNGRTYVVPDMNIFLHFRDFEHLPWADEVGTAPVTVLITTTLLKELDKHKRDARNARRQRRARAINTKLGNLLAQDGEPRSIRPDVSIDLAVVGSILQTLEKHDLDRLEADDCLLAEVLKAKEQDPSSRFILYTDDTGPYLRARQLGLEAKKPSEELRVADEPDPLEKENRELRAENERLKNAFPRLDVNVNGQHSSKPIRVTLAMVPCVETGMVARAVTDTKPGRPRRKFRACPEPVSRLTSCTQDASSPVLRRMRRHQAGLV